MTKLLSRPSTSDDYRLASRIRNALVRGIILFAAVLLFTSDGAVAQTTTSPCTSVPTADRGNMSFTNFGVQRTRFSDFLTSPRNVSGR